MQCLITMLELLAILAVAFSLGLPWTKILLPRDVEQAYGTFIAPTIGYLMFCMLVFTISGSFHTTVVPTCWGTFAFLLAVAVLTQLNPACRITQQHFFADLKLSAWLILPMVGIILFPLFYFGAKSYLGAVNPDYFAGLVDNYYLLKGHSVANFTALSTNTYSPMDIIAGTVNPSARFGAEMFGILIQLVLGVPTRTALSLLIAFCLINIPLTMYFFTSFVLGFTRRQALWSSMIMGISAPIGMSYLYYYIGQNSGLPALILVTASAYLMLKRPGWNTLAFCAFIANALFINYFAMLPYALAPAGVLGLYLLATRRISLKVALLLIVGFAGVFVASHLGDVANIVKSMTAWGHVIGQSLQGQFFLDFLTELCLPLMFGLSEYPLSNSWVRDVLGDLHAAYFVLTMAGLVLVFWVASIVAWLKNTKEPERKVFMIAAVLIYFSVWWMYSFPRQYAYAIFKMSTWLQFVIVPFMIYGLFQLQKVTTTRHRLLFYPVLGLGYVVGFFYLFLNLINSIEYGYNGFGRNTTSGYIVNNFEMSGNNDYFALPEAVAQHVKPNESIMLVFVDSIQNHWVSYYLKQHRLSMPFHENMPGDDENMPDAKTSLIMDYYGNVRKIVNPLAHDYQDDYLLTWNTDHLNQDIVDQHLHAKPVWENHTFRLYKTKEIGDVLATGRGFYRLEYFNPHEQYWMPRVMRWSSQGGEFYLLQTRHPNKPYRFAFDAIVGSGGKDDSRTLELWLNGKNIQNIKITDAARVMSMPFHPRAGMNKLVVHIQEVNHPAPRKVALWNNDIPADYRRLNIGFANAHILAPGDKPYYKEIEIGKPIPVIKLFDYAEQFNGLKLDGWIADRASLSFNIPTTVKALEITGMLPAVYHFPYRVTATINGQKVQHIIAAPGQFTWKLPIQSHQGVANLELAPSQVNVINNKATQYNDVRQSLRIESINFV